MRFVSAIVAFVLAAGMIAFGIAQRTVLAPDPRVTERVAVDSDAAFTVIDGSVLNSFPGQQRLVATGSDPVFASYARTDDMLAWLGEEQYNRISYDAENGELVSEVVTPEPPAAVVPADGADAEEEAEEIAPTPEGSDLWLEQTTGASTLNWTVNVPDDISVLLASNGSDPAPSTVSVSWPVSHSTPWAGPLIIGGGVLLIVGLGLYIWGLVHMRRTRGPRRKSSPKPPKMQGPPRIKAPKAEPLEPVTTAKGRRSIRQMTAALALGGASLLVLTGCSNPEIDEYFGDAPLPSPTASASAEAEAELTPVAVTQPQIERIIEDVATVAAEADAARDLDLLKTRFTGPALEEREANYAMRGADEGIAAPDAIPSETIELHLPEATEVWPRRVLAIVGSEDEATPPTALVLVQESPRANYLVSYAVRLQPDVTFPEVAPPTVGATVIAPDNRLLAAQPDQLASQYADILARGAESESYETFAEEPDGLRTQVGVDKKNERIEAFPDTASLEFSSEAGDGPLIAFATNQSGAIVAADVVERETARPTEEGATVNPSGSVKALSGVSSTDKGVESTYGYQLLFYVPPSTSENGEVILLGYSQGLISAREL